MLVFVVGLQNLQLIAGFKLLTLGTALIAFLLAALPYLAPGIAAIFPTAPATQRCQSHITSFSAIG